jgi:hypothetical protein
MKRFLCLLLLGLSCLATGRAAPPEVDPRLKEEPFLYEVLRYTYLWYLDDRFFVETASHTSFEVWIRTLKPPAPDAGDASRYAEIWLPAAGLQFRLKLADYFIPELQRQVRSPGYRIVRAAPLAAAPHPREDYVVVTLARDKARKYLFDARNQPQAPDQALRKRLLAAVREVAKQNPPTDPTQPQVFFLSDVSPVSGDLWVLWINAKRAIRFGGELGADQPDLLEHLQLQTQVFDFKRQVVTSLLETEGSTGFITKDWAGRILYQCLVLGERAEVSPADMGL